MRLQLTNQLVSLFLGPTEEKKKMFFYEDDNDAKKKKTILTGESRLAF